MKKCSVCGSEKVVPFESSAVVSGDAHVCCEVTVCLDCKHIDLWAHDGGIYEGRFFSEAKARYYENIKKQEEWKAFVEEAKQKQKELALLEPQLPNLQKELDDLKIKVNDENITIKQQRELFEQIHKKETEILHLNQKINDYKEIIRKAGLQ